MDNAFIAYDECLGTSIINLKFQGFLCVENKLQTLKFNALKSFCGMCYNKVLFSVDESDKITLVSILFPEIMSQRSYLETIKIYGDPKAMFIYDKIIKEHKTENLVGFKQNLVKREFSTKPVKFQEHPQFLIWKKSDFEIKVHLHYEQNATRIMFMKSDNT